MDTVITSNESHLAGTHATYDPGADALYLTLGPPIPPGGAAFTRTVGANEDIMADYDAQGHLLGFEVLGVSRLPVTRGAPAPAVRWPGSRTERVRVACWVLPAVMLGMGVGWLAGTLAVRVLAVLVHYDGARPARPEQQRRRT